MHKSVGYLPLMCCNNELPLSFELVVVITVYLSSRDHTFAHKKHSSLFPGKRPSEACIPPPSPRQCPKYSWRRFVCFTKTSSDDASTALSKANDCSTKIPLSLESFLKCLPTPCHLQIKPVSSHPNPSSPAVQPVPSLPTTAFHIFAHCYHGCYWPSPM